jgi:hypothetical protein
MPEHRVDGECAAIFGQGDLPEMVYLQGFLQPPVISSGFGIPDRGSPAAIAQVHDAILIITLVIADGHRFFIGMVVGFDNQVDVVFFQYRNPMLPDLCWNSAIKIAYTGPCSHMILNKLPGFITVGVKCFLQPLSLLCNLCDMVGIEG